MIYEGSRIKTVWFDLDDTLIDFRTNSRAALRIVYDSVEPIRLLFADAEAWTERYEFHNHRLWDQYSRAEIDRDTLRMDRFRLPLAEAGMTDTEARRLSEFLDTYYLDRLAEQKNLIPGAIELIDAIKNRWPDIRIGVLSNGFADVQHRKIRNAGLQALRTRRAHGRLRATRQQPSYRRQSDHRHCRRSRRRLACRMVRPQR